MTLKTDNYQIGLDSVTDSKNYLLDTDITGALRIRRNSDGSGLQVLNISPDGETIARIKQIAAKTLTGTAVTWSTASSDAAPSWAKKATLIISSGSTNAATSFRFRIGPVAGVETSGYLGSSGTTLSGSAASINFTAGFDIADGAIAGTTVHGVVVLTLLSAATNTWVISGILGQSDVARAMTIGGTKPLAGPLSVIEVTTVSGAGTFDAGSVSVIYEG